MFRPVLGLLLVLALASLGFVQTDSSPPSGHTKDSLDTIKSAVAAKKAVLVDVREKREWEAGHLQDALLLPLSTLKGGAKDDEVSRLLSKERVIYCHCASGVRCLQAAEILRKQGYDARPLRPGYKELLQAGFPQAPR